MPKLKIMARGCVPAEKTSQNIAHAHSLGLPMAITGMSNRLAVVGGGPSVKKHIEELINWRGDVWIIGTAFKYLKSKGVTGEFFSIHPSPRGAENVAGVQRAIVASCSDPSVFEALDRAYVRIFDLQGDQGGSSSTAAPCQALRMDYSEVHFFGCDSSYEESSHAYANVADVYDIQVTCNGKTFRSCLEFLLQAQYLSAIFRTAPKVFHNRSDGLLKAMVETREIDAETGTGDYDLTHLSRHIARDIGQLEAA